MPEKHLPFLEMFFQYHPAPALAEILSGWLVTGAVLDSHKRTIEAQLLCPERPEDALLAQVAQELAQVYALAGVTFVPSCPPPAPVPQQEHLPEQIPAEEAPVVSPAPSKETFLPPEEAGAAPTGPDEALPPIEDLVPPPEEVPSPALEELTPPSEEIPSPEEALSEQERLFRQTEELRQKAMARAKAADKETRGFSSKRIYGTRQIKKVPRPMNTLELDMGVVVVEGDVFAVEHRELKKRNAWVISFDVTDYTSSIRVSKFMPGDEGTSWRGSKRECT